MESRPLNIKEVIDSVLSTFHFENNQDIDLQLNFDDTIPKKIIGDSIRLQQVLGNLLNNAYKFTERGHIILSVSQQGNSSDKSNIVFEVEDTGIGIDDALLATLFRPFHQVDRSTTRKYGGTGLGLAICKQLVNAMGGHISATSTLGKGSKFVFNIPLVTAQNEELTIHTVENTVNLEGMKVLVAEDNEVNCMVIKALLNAMAVKVDIVGDGLAAIDRINKNGNEYDAVLMDCEMPLMDGYQCTTEIRKRESLNQMPRLPICAVTAHVLPEHVQHCMVVGMDYHVPKPVDKASIKEFLSKVRNNTLS